jgi:phenylacetate-CoA ligase
VARRRPAFLVGYPSALASLVRLAEGRFDGWSPKAILYSSEPLHAHQRSVLEQAFPVPIYGYYGCAERAVSATECEAGHYHLNVVDGYFHGQFGTTSHDARTHVTSLLNTTMPLVRYQIGDLLQVDQQESCSCGRTLPMIADVVTKEEDVLVTRTGRRISPSVLTWAFKDLPGLESSRIVQMTESEIVVNVVVAAPSFSAVRNALNERLGRLTFGELKIDVVRCDYLQTTAVGKARFVVGLRD